MPVFFNNSIIDPSYFIHRHICKQCYQAPGSNASAKYYLSATVCRANFQQEHNYHSIQPADNAICPYLRDAHRQHTIITLPLNFVTPALFITTEIQQQNCSKPASLNNVWCRGNMFQVLRRRWRLWVIRCNVSTKKGRSKTEQPVTGF